MNSKNYDHLTDRTEVHDDTDVLSLFDYSEPGSTSESGVTERDIRLE